MAGDFGLTSIASSDLIIARDKGCGWSGLAHAAGAAAGPGLPPHAGWTPATRAALRQALAPAGVPNRNAPPPHRCLTFGPFAPGPLNALQEHRKGRGRAASLQRPNMGLTALAPAARAAWNAGDRRGALLAQGGSWPAMAGLQM